MAPDATYNKSMSRCLTHFFISFCISSSSSGVSCKCSFIGICKRSIHLGRIVLMACERISKCALIQLTKLVNIPSKPAAIYGYSIVVNI